MTTETSETAWPRKTRELHDHHFDSTVWNEVTFRDDDIVIATYAKAGTTWMQQIVAQLIFHGATPDADVASMSPWVDLRVPPKAEKLAALEAQTHRRFLKTHLPVDALVFSPRAKYVYVARDGRDIVWSLYHHHVTASVHWYQALNDTPGRVGPPMGLPPASVRQYFLDWLEKDGYPFWPFWEHVQSWWAIRRLPNVHLVHFAALKADLAGQIRRIAGFLGLSVDEERWDAIVQHCEFAYMKAHAEQSVPLRGLFWQGGASTFLHKGTNGRWRNVLTAQETERYERRAEEALGPECALWLATGELPGGEPEC